MLSETPVGSIITLAFVRIGMILAIVLLVTVVSIFMIGPIIKLVGNRKEISKGLKRKGGEGLLTLTLLLNKTFSNPLNQYKSTSLTIPVQSVRSK